MGGGTGTGGAPIVAEIAKEVGALTVAVVTKPFVFEAKKKMKQAEEGLKALKGVVDTVITIPNQRLLSIASKTTSLTDAFKKANEILHQAVKGISDIITTPGLVNVDFADVRTIMSEMGLALMGSGVASGENRAVEAAKKAISSPLLEDISIHGAKGVLINITGASDMTLHEVNEASMLIQEEAHEDAHIIFGAVVDDKIGEEVRVTVIATGFGKEESRRLTAVGRNIAPAVVIGDLDIPTIVRKEKEKKSEVGPAEVQRLKPLGGFNAMDEDAFDTPTFLRKQAD